MAIAKKCDRCGKLYEDYGKVSSAALKANGVKLVYSNGIDEDRDYNIRSYDLCPDCLKGVKDYLLMALNEEAK